MDTTFQTSRRLLQDSLQLVASTVFTLGALACFAATALAFAGILPWLQLPASFGTTPVNDFGQFLQLGVTAALMCLCLFVPASLRVLRLEARHREFAITMNDVASAYAAAHKLDRDGAFRLEREFDAVRERYQRLRDTPDFVALSKDILIVAAQMSAESRDLADALATEKIDRAKGVLDRRRAQITELETAVETLTGEVAEMRRDADALDAKDSLVQGRIQTAMNDLAALSDRVAEASSKRAGTAPGVTRLRVASAQRRRLRDGEPGGTGH